MRIFTLLSLVVLFSSISLPAIPHAEKLANVTCNADLVCVKVYKKAREVNIVLENKTHKPLSFRLFFTTHNLQHLNPKTQTLSQPGTTQLVSFTAPIEKWGYEYRIHYGYESHEHDDSYLYTLPYKPGSSYPVTQSHENISTHRYGNLYALDWAMPTGDSVHAARNLPRRST